MRIESAKIEIMMNQTEKILKQDSNSKVVIFVSFMGSVELLSNYFESYNPIILTGSVSKYKRQALISLFQEPNNKHRLFIGNLKVCSSGISLDDQFGQFPRFVFISPSYTIDHLHQATKRVFRAKTMSNAVVRFVYGKTQEDYLLLENSILKSLSRKTNVFKTILPTQVEDGEVFPGDYEDVYDE